MIKMGKQKYHAEDVEHREVTEEQNEMTTKLIWTLIKKPKQGKYPDIHGI